jgi:hypothetical protein
MQIRHVHDSGFAVAVDTLKDRIQIRWLDHGAAARNDLLLASAVALRQLLFADRPLDGCSLL